MEMSFNLFSYFLFKLVLKNCTLFEFLLKKDKLIFFNFLKNFNFLFSFSKLNWETNCRMNCQNYGGETNRKK